MPGWSNPGPIGAPIGSGISPSIERYEKSVAGNRERFVQAVGGLPRVTDPLKPRVERIADEPGYRAERVWLNMAPGLEVYGILLRPLTDTGKHPALICVHGLGSSPERVCGILPEDYTKNFGVRAAKLGYVVFAPFITNDVKLKARLDRKAVLLGTRLQGIEEGKILRVVDFLYSLPYADAKRIGIYGISWGGRTSMYSAAIDRRIAAAVISGHFNQTAPKMTTKSEHYVAYIDTAEEYAFFSGIAREFSDSDVASLIAPRPVFIEQGSRDTVAYHPMAKAEFDILHSFYERLKIPDRCEFGLFEGEHVVHGDQAFEFLARWLKPR